MSVATVKVATTIAQQAYKHRTKLFVISASFSMLLFAGAFFVFMGSDSQGGNSGTAKVNEKVEAWRPVVTQYAEKYGIPDYVDVILAIMMVESGGDSLDIMQSSESIGLPPNSIGDPTLSIDVGVKHLSNVVKDAKKKKLDFWTPVQSYNFGGGFNDYVSKHGKQYTFQLASDFAKKMANGVKTKYSNPVADFNGNYRYMYGNMYYVKLVQQYLNAPSGEMGNADASALGAKDYKELMTEVSKYDGWGYTWGGSNPNVGFDCSGLTQYAFGKIGYNLPRTAAEQYNTSIKVADPQPGDLIFFKGTNSSRPANSITHVGIYVDEKRMYDANNSGIGYSTWNQGYWKSHLAGFGRVIK
ncbi:bifunctional lytic transglycosylase/C40 family peptidase [Bacillus haynesii]|uniref:bifunctional lytic transglycosylase/C40 family peptidase n=1 Tax=Bacillus haynesii TaxID=1925021 RepID=UPI0022832B62|nr:bifunctional lytic transglycosylase/C40 family peptidase [Bacillus haynesii]MCY8737574.1 bifunctional lysozyme/C40 family peptidase [Bacillus haynesii]MEC0709767.1 bifunctional lytic transglycosylase/C40 family peptidase [Bacillus haynesii]MEC0736854.1 bifunctional lytic transglycosylase/C40 family peptidase [Bacillus haynesii]